jgi:hypothetical protein
LYARKGVGSLLVLSAALDSGYIFLTLIGNIKRGRNS